MITRENGSGIDLPAYYVLLPAWYITGTMIVTWLVYIVAYFSQNEAKPLIFGNVIVLGILLAAGFLFCYYFTWKEDDDKTLTNPDLIVRFFWNGHVSYAIYALLALAFCIVIMYKSFNVTDATQLNVGYSVWADFGAHLSMIRSFSYGNNFPTQYAYYGDSDIRYHFMHEFLVGNLEFLGLRLDHAFNIPSVMNLFSTYLLLFTLTVTLFKCKLTAWIGGLLFTFRSSFAVFDFLAKDRSGHPIAALLANSSYFALSEGHESWGFWCTRVFCNQRHFAFGISALLLAVLIFLPYLKEMGENVAHLKRDGVPVKRTRLTGLYNEDGEEVEETIFVGIEPRPFDYIKLCFFSRDSFAVKSPGTAIGAGLFLGALAFWHGSALIATLAMLFFMAAFSVCRLDYLIAAVMAVIMAIAQSRFFIFEKAVDPKYEFGFLAENKTFFGVLAYILLLTGITLLLAVFGMIMVRGVERYMFLVCLVPFIMSFFLSLTPDVAVNHKWVIISLMLTSMYTAHFVSAIFRQPGMISAITASILLIVLTATGVAELYIQYKEDRNYMSFDMNDEVTMWLKDNLTSDDLVLYTTYPLNRVVLSGVMHYYCYPYCSWSAGYDSSDREKMVKRIFAASDSRTLDYFIYKSNIDIIILDESMREDYRPNEALIESTYKEIWHQGEGEWSFRVFDTRQPIYR
ncbi:MAG: hypothetical protein K6G60_00930 [Lachnospiraceae bacterium]|nr:hypothetical protein [Lachnospiraceae bacterium]